MKKFVTVLSVAITVFLVIEGGIAVVEQLKSGMGNGPSAIWKDDFEVLVEEICSGKESDRQKVTAIYDWIVENIRYDYDAQTVYQYFDINSTLQTKKGVCFDYASLFAAMCRSQKIPCHIIDGYGREDSSLKHTWNRVFYDGFWWNLDVTYDAVHHQSSGKVYGFHNIGTDYTVEDPDCVITRIY